VHRRTFLATTAAAAAITTVSGQALAAGGNPLLPPFVGPHGGLPPFDKIKDSDYLPAFEEGMRQHLADVRKIADSSEPASTPSLTRVS
jgi:peptidyl-dipeptidase Dcp